MFAKKILKYINSIPFPLTIRHYEKFDGFDDSLKDSELNSPESWDLLRENHSHFSLADTREEWLKASESLVKKDGQDGGLKKRAEDISNLFRKIGVENIFSVGVGGAGLEYQIKKNIPDTNLVCSEYSKVNIELLKKVFIECEKIIFFDIKNSSWSEAISDTNPKKQVCLLYRVDPHLTDEEWREVFKNMSLSGIENILFIPCGYITIKSIGQRFYRRMIWKMKNIKYVFSGFLRTRHKFITLWEGYYEGKEMDFGGLKGFLLRKI